jgi:hypothetical protein
VSRGRDGAEPIAKAQEGVDPLKEMRLLNVRATRAIARLIGANVVRQ